MKCLFLGYNSKQTKLINFLRKNKISVTNKKSKVSENEIRKYDLIISFGYRKSKIERIGDSLRVRTFRFPWDWDFGMFFLRTFTTFFSVQH